jgi:hypothetical protein
METEINFKINCVYLVSYLSEPIRTFSPLE